MTILGITWNGSVLVSFDPATGVILETHAWLPPAENFVGLAYDDRRNVLYAIAQVTRGLYAINPLTRDVRFVGNVNTGGDDVAGLTYDPVRDVLYTAILRQGATPFSDLATVNRDTGAAAVIGKIANGLCVSLCWRDSDAQLNGLVIPGPGPWDSPLKASCVTIDPTTGAATPIFQTTYHTILGLARVPGKNGFVSWTNWTTHFYADVDLSANTVTALAQSDAVGVTSAAMLLRSFYVAPAPNLPPCSFTTDNCLG
jgi:hypothetical protein